VPGSPTGKLTTLWAADDTMRYPDGGEQPPATNFFAPIGGFRLVEFMVTPQHAPRPQNIDKLTVAEQTERLFPGLLATMKSDIPGMHRSHTIDLLYVIAGRVILELDDGSETELNAGDVAVQSGTMHAWRNPWDEPCRVLGVILGATVADTP
jgi:quercetin dioxygenase-like cupin family protein